MSLITMKTASFIRASGLTRLMMRNLHQASRDADRGVFGAAAAAAADTDQKRDRDFKAIVLGGGPAGIATVGTLLDNHIRPILWVDRSFTAGRLNNRYREVPSNTKVSLFIDFARATAPFRAIVDSSQDGDAYTALQVMDQGKGCQIKHAADLCLQLTEGLKSSKDVHASYGDAQAAVQDESGKWHVSVHAKDSRITTGSASLLILCNGASPNAPLLPSKYPNLQPLDLDLALAPTKLSSHLPRSKSQTVALIGASHSAILVLRNLYELASSTHPALRVKWFSRHPLRYAVDKGDWILRDNTGLKGETAIWAKENLEDGVFEGSDVGRFVEKVFSSPGEQEQQHYAEHLPQCDQVVEAVGFTRDPIPELSKRDVSGKESSIGDVKCDHRTGGFADSEGQKLRGLYGAGIAWPERVTDPEGNTEMAVGLWKFMKYLKRVVPNWS